MPPDFRLCCSIWIGVVAVAVGAVGGVARAAPPLTQEERTRLGGATDGSPRWDESAMYPLIQNAVAWAAAIRGGEALDAEEAHIPPYARLVSDPEPYRGGLSLIGGKFVEAEVVQLNRAGPWGERAVRWAVLPKGAEDETVLILFPEATGVPPTPRPGQEVRVRARFFKLWSYPRRPKRGEDAKAKPPTVTFPLFVAPAAAALVMEKGPDTAWTRGQGTGHVGLLVLAVVVVAAGFVLVLWKVGRIPRILPGMGAAAPLRTRAAVIEERQRRRSHESLDSEEDAEPLPEDPNEALAELERRREMRTEQDPAADAHP